MTPEERDAHVRKTLYERYDRLNTLYQKWEAYLSSFHIPRPVEVLYERTADDWGCWLGVAKCGSKWRIVHCSAPIGIGSEMMEWEPITECAVIHRVRAARHIEKLAAAIPEQAEQFVKTVEGAITALESSLQAKAGASSADAPRSVVDSDGTRVFLVTRRSSNGRG